MGEIDRISDQMKCAFGGGAWHGPSLTEVLENVDAAAATRKPIPAAHSIWEIILHLIATQDLVLARLQGIAKELTPEEDWPPVSDGSETAWADTIRQLIEHDEQMRARVAAIEDQRLDEPLVDGGSSAYDNLHGYIQHNLYHAGQIAILKKQLLA